MVSTLASQLQTLREAGAGSKQKTDTFLYDPREAARVDNETIYNLAWNGLLELKQMDARFDEFDTNPAIVTLFSRQRIHFHRAQLSKQEDTELNSALGKVLDALSGYFLLGATHKVLEFLVRRYEVHRFNVDDVMATIISYHESTWFARMVRILHISGTRWEFLLAVKQTGEPLLRAALVQRAIDDASVVDFVFATAVRIGASNPKLVSLYTLLTLQMLEQSGPMREATLRTLIPQVLTALKTAAQPELQAAAFMVVTKLSSKAVLTAKVTDTLAKHLVKFAQPGTHMNALLCVVFLAQTQPSFVLSPSVGKHLLALDGLVELLSDAAQSYDTAAFVRALVLFLAGSLAAPSSDADAAYRVLRSLVATLPFSDALVAATVHALLQHAAGEAFDATQPRVQAVASVLVALSKQYIAAVDTAVSAVFAAPATLSTDNSDGSSAKQSKRDVKRMHAFLQATFAGVANSAHFVPTTTDATTSLALALEHPNEHTRYQALVALAKQSASAGDGVEPVLSNGDVLLRRMLDDSPRVVKFVFTSALSDLVVRVVRKRACLETLERVVAKWSQKSADKQAAPTVLDAAFTFAGTKFRTAFDANESDDQALLLLLLPLLPVEHASVAIAMDLDVVVNHIMKLAHPFSLALKHNKTKRGGEASAQRVADVLGAAVALHVPQLLPFCLSWSQPLVGLDIDERVAPAALTPLLVHVLHAARSHARAAKKPAPKDIAALDQALRFVLKREFAAVCERQHAAPDVSAATVSEAAAAVEAAVEWAVALADMLSDVVANSDAATTARNDVVATLLQAPTTIFVQIQPALLGLFANTNASIEREVLSTMAHLVASTTTATIDPLTLLVKSRALDMISAVLEGFAYTESASDLAPVVHVLPSVLVALADASGSVRTGAIACLERWLASSSDRVLASRVTALHTLQRVSTYLLQAKTDIRMDAIAVRVRCGAYATATTPAAATAFYQLLLDFVTSATTRERATAIQLLELLTHVTDVSFWRQSVDYFTQTLAVLAAGDASDSESSDAETTTVLSLLLARYVDVSVAIATASTKAKANAAVPKVFVDALLAVLHVDDSNVDALARVQSLQVAALACVTPAFYVALDPSIRIVLVTALLQLLVVADERVASALIRCLAALPVHYDVFTQLLTTELAAVAGLNHAIHTRGVERKEDALFQHVSCILEVLAMKIDAPVDGEEAAAVDRLSTSNGAYALLKALGDVLAVFCETDHDGLVSEYILQVLFGCLRRVCEVHSAASNEVLPLTTTSTKSKKTKTKKTTHDAIEPERLVQHTLACLHRTTSPQTRNDALLFTSALVDLFPANVLASLETILSFVGGGSSIASANGASAAMSLHHDDAHSFHVLETIVRAVVPHIVRSRKSEGDAKNVTPQQLIRIFVDAYEQLPRSRRAQLFDVVLEALGRSDALPYVVAALLQRSVRASTNKRDELVAFAHALCFTSSAPQQIAALETLLSIAQSLLPHVRDDDADTDNDDDNDDDTDADSDDTGAYGAFAFDAALVGNKRDAQALNTALVAFVPAHLQARPLHHKILTLEQTHRRSRHKRRTVGSSGTKKAAGNNAVGSDDDTIDMDNDDEHDDDNDALTNPSDDLQHRYLLLAQRVLLYFRRVAHYEAANASLFWSTLAATVVDVLGALQRLLSTPGFVAVISELLHHESSLVRKKAMQLFNDRLTNAQASKLSSGEALLFVDMLDDLDSILLNADGNENSVNVQTALLSVDLLARTFAAMHAKRFQASLPTIVRQYIHAVDVTKATPTTLHVFACAFVCVSSICRAVGGPLVFPLLPQFFPQLLVGINHAAKKLYPTTRSTKHADATSTSGLTTVLQCLLAALEVFTDKLAPFLAPYLPAIIQTLLSPSLLAAKAPNAVVAAAVDATTNNLTTRVELRHVLPNVCGAFDATLLLESDASVAQLFAVVTTIVDALDATALRQHLPAIARFFVTALDARRLHTAKLQDVDAVEDVVLESFVAFVLKLSEKQLKPLFLKVAEWSQVAAGGKTTKSAGHLARRIVFFKLVVKLSQRLRGIFVPYFAHVLEPLVHALTDARTTLATLRPSVASTKATGRNAPVDSDDDDDFFTRIDDEEDEEETAAVVAPAAKRSKLANGRAEATTTRADYVLLLRTAVQALDGCFVYDSDGFMEKERLELVLAPLVDVFDVLQHDASSQMRAFVLETVAPCIAHLAAAAKSDLLWKPLHYAVLMKSRSSTPVVRLATLETIEQCYHVIGDEFLAMLPESIPFLAELMEDTNAEVERTCHRVIKQIEDISGESLDQYLTS